MEARGAVMRIAAAEDRRSSVGSAEGGRSGRVQDARLEIECKSVAVTHQEVMFLQFNAKDAETRNAEQSSRLSSYWWWSPPRSNLLVRSFQVVAGTGRKREIYFVGVATIVSTKNPDG